MSALVFPTLAGLEWNILRSPIWSTTKKPSVSGRRFAVANYAFPRYKYSLSFSVLRQGGAYTELSQIVGLFNQCGGDFDTFLFPDPDDFTVTAQTLGVGNGVATQFQLVRTFGGFVEPVYDVNSAPLIYVNAVLKTLTTDYTISATGLVTFVAAPGAALPVTWTGTYYRRVAFSQSQLDFNKFMQNLWELKKVEFESWRP
jgi:uncharacterized protein (TIGR02217 family)